MADLEERVGVAFGSDMDLVLDDNGSGGFIPRTIQGVEAMAQAVRLRLLVRRGSYKFNRALGLPVHRLTVSAPDEYFVGIFAREALLDPDVVDVDGELTSRDANLRSRDLDLRLTARDGSEVEVGVEL